LFENARKPNFNEPVRIQGAGPAGLTAAIGLAQKGVRVEIYEKRDRCGARFRGDLQGIENWTEEPDFLEELRSFGIRPAFLCAPVKRAIGICPRGRMSSMGRDNGTVFYLVKRGTMADSLDTALQKQAVENGVRIHFGSSIAEEDAHIVAGGPSARHIWALASGIVFETSHPDCAFVQLDNESAYLGYSYLLIASGYGCLTNALYADFANAPTQFAKAKASLVEASGLCDLRNVVRCGGYSTYSHTKRFEEEGRLYVGEAARIQDPLWGFGLRHAMRSGSLAARSLLGELDYAREAERAFGPSMRTGLVNRWLWELTGHHGYRKIISDASTSPDLREYLGNHFAPCLLKSLVFPLAREWLRRRKQHLTPVRPPAT